MALKQVNGGASPSREKTRSSGGPSTSQVSICLKRKRHFDPQSPNWNTSRDATMRVKQDIQAQRKALPIFEGRETIISEIQANNTVVILGETGSGKTTQVPQYLHEAGLSRRGMIGITQTRRVAATSLAQRISDEQGCKLGTEVGYSVRFEEVSSPQTRIKFLTDGMLVQTLLSDPLLEAYSVIIIDEAHERTLRTDLLLSRLKDIQKQRNSLNPNAIQQKLYPLKVVIMSATLDAEKFSQFYDGAAILYVQGRQHPVKIFYTSEAQHDFLDAAMKAFFQIHNEEETGDILIFLPGQEDIEALQNSIMDLASQLPPRKQKVLVCPLYSALPSAMQSQVFKTAPPNTRKCILATNIAETAITIPGVKFVIDTGTYKEKSYSSKIKTGIEALITKPISRDSAMQRAGRAGREGPGYCYRLYTEQAFSNLRESAPPEILRSNLASSTLQLKYLGQEPEALDWMDSPSPEAFQAALFNLYSIEAMDANRQLTPLGKQMARLPVEPSFARALLASKPLKCSAEVLDLVSLFSAGGNAFYDPSDSREKVSEARKMFNHPSGDHLLLLNVFRGYVSIASQETRKMCTEWCRAHFVNEKTMLEAKKIRNQLSDACRRMDIELYPAASPDPDAILRCFATGMPQNLARISPEGGYRQLLGSGQVKVHPSSSLIERRVPAIIYNELVLTTQIYARCVSSIPAQHIQELFLFSQRFLREISSADDRNEVSRQGPRALKKE